MAAVFHCSTILQTALTSIMHRYNRLANVNPINIANPILAVLAATRLFAPNMGIISLPNRRRHAMQIMMTPGLCSNEHRNTGGTFCESCFAAFLMHGCYPDRACITDVVDDGKEAITLVLRYGDYLKAVQLTDEQRANLAFGGWHGWLDFVEDLPSVLAPHN
jgi:hypothetical protein